MNEAYSKNELKITRRKFLKAGITVAVSAIPLSAATDAAIETNLLEVSHVEMPVEGLPPAFEGFRIAHLTDLHLSDKTSMKRIRCAIDEANAARPDMIALTGDYVTGNRCLIPAVFEELRRLSAPHGIVAVLGNHDHWVDTTETRKYLVMISAADLTNSNIIIERGDAGLCFAGVGDMWEDIQDIDAALRNVDPGTPRVLLSHNPDFAEKIPEGYRVDFMISGHTHGGQVVLPIIGALVVPSAYGRKYSAGLVQGPHCPVYISRGIGVIGYGHGLRFRFNCRPEIPIYTLRAKK